MLDHLWITSILFSFINNKIFVFHLLYNLVYLGKYVLNTYFCNANYQYCNKKHREREREEKREERVREILCIKPFSLGCFFIYLYKYVVKLYGLIICSH